MNTESLSLLLSFLSLLLVPCAIVLSVFSVNRFALRKGWPSARDWLQACLMSVGITLAITLAICLVFKWTGFFDAQFYRPSSRDYGRVQELGLAPEDVSFNSPDGTELHGWFLPAEDAVGTVICFHGSDRNITYTIGNVHWLTNHQLNVFVFDYRGYGASEGVPSREALVDDSRAAIDYVSGRNDVDGQRIVLFGQSMGGQLAINAALEAPEVRLVVSEATYAKQSYHISDKLSRMGPLWLVKWGAWLLTSDQFSGESAIARLSVPVLLVHGTADTGVAPYHSDRLLAAATGPKELWQYEGYGHLQIFKEEDNQRRLAEYILNMLGETPQ